MRYIALSDMKIDFDILTVSVFSYSYLFGMIYEGFCDSFN